MRWGVKETLCLNGCYRVARTFCRDDKGQEQHETCQVCNNIIKMHGLTPHTGHAKRWWSCFMQQGSHNTGYLYMSQLGRCRRFLHRVVSVACLLSPSGPQVREGLGENHVRPSLVVLELGSWELGAWPTCAWGSVGWGLNSHFLALRQRQDCTGMARVGEAKTREVSVCQTKAC